jgi:Zn-dependent protease
VGDFVRFYKIDSRQIRVREWRASTGLLTWLLGWSLGRLGINLAASQRAVHVLDWGKIALAEKDVPTDVLAHFATRTQELKQLGFHAPVYFQITNFFNGYEEFTMLALGTTGRTMARLFWVRGLPGCKIRERFETGFFTAFEDGRSVWTCDQPLRSEEPPQVFTQHGEKLTVPELFQSHEATVEATTGAAAKPVQSSEHALAIYSKWQNDHFDFHLQRGTFREVTPAEAETDALFLKSEQNAVAQGSQFGAAWAELQKEQAKKVSWISGVVLLVLSLGASAVVGFEGASAQSLALILGVLFFHELGHYLAMRVFKYRNVKMFFLPGFGAAVTGSHYNVAGWKKAFVSLLGPVPGIWLGAGLAGSAFVSGNAAFHEVAWLLLIINTMNLLPVVPLDGGWFWNTVLFSRNRWLEAAFKGAAALIGIAASFAGLGRIWLFLAIATLISLPLTLLQGRAAEKLRRQGFTPEPGSNDKVPFATAELIFGELDSSSKTKLSPKLLAVHGLQVFERLNAVPPKWLQALGLISIYAVSLIVAVIGMVLLYVGKNDLTKTWPAINQSQSAEVPPVLDAPYNGGARRYTGAAFEPKKSERFLLAKFSSPENALAAYRKVLAQKNPSVDVVLFGPSLLVETHQEDIDTPLPLAADLTAAGGTVYNNADQESWFRLNLRATASTPAVAAEIHQEIDLWLSMPVDLRPPAPWLKPIDPAVKRSCETFRKIEALRIAAFASPELQIHQQFSFLTGLFGGREKAVARMREFSAARSKETMEAVAKLRASRDPNLDDALLAHELERPPLLSDDRLAQRAWDAKQRELITGKPQPASALASNVATKNAPDEPSEEAYATEDEHVRGEIRLVQQTLTLQDLSFGSPNRDFPALAIWLAKRGCSELIYGVQKHDLKNWSAGFENED